MHFHGVSVEDIAAMLARQTQPGPDVNRPGRARGRDERVPQRGRATGLVIPAQRVTRRTRCAVTVQPPPITAAVTACHARLPPRLAQFGNRPSYAGVLQ